MDEKIIIQKDGQEVECDVLFTFTCEETGKGYVGYTDHSFDSKNRKNIYTASFDPVLGMGTLEKIKTDEEKEMVKEVLEQVYAEGKGNNR